MLCMRDQFNNPEGGARLIIRVKHGSPQLACQRYAAASIARTLLKVAAGEGEWLQRLKLSLGIIFGNFGEVLM